MHVSSFLTTKREEPPVCYGKDWDKNAPECAGGADPNFQHPRTGTNVRDQCDFFQSCGARCAATRNANGSLIPPQQIVRPSVVTPPPQHSSPQTFGQWLSQAQTQHTLAQTQAAMQSIRPPAQQVQLQSQVVAGNAVNPATMWQLNYSMPGYLSAPESRLPGETIWAVLLREVVRSVFKAIGHSVAHFFDARPLKEK